MKIIFLRWIQSEYTFYENFMDGYIAAAEQLGFPYRVFNLKTIGKVMPEEVPHFLQLFDDFQPDLVIDIATWGNEVSQIKRDGNFIFGADGPTYCLLMLDHPQHQGTVANVEKLLVTCLDRQNLSCLEYLSGPEAQKWQRLFLPCAVTPCEEPLTPIRERDIDVFYCGNYNIHDPLQQLRNVYRPEQIERRINDMCLELVEADEKMPFHIALEKTFAHFSVNINDGAKFQVRRDFLRNIELAFRMHKRYEYLKQIAGSGLNIHVIGEGWEKSPLADYFVLQRHLDYDSLNKLYRRSKITLYASNYTDGMTDRPVNAFNYGSVCIQDTSTYMMESMPNQAVYLPYKDRAQLPELVHSLLSNSSYMQDIVDSAFKIVRDKHTYLHRLKHLARHVS